MVKKLLFNTMNIIISGVPLGSGDMSRPQSTSSRSSCEYQPSPDTGYMSPGDHHQYRGQQQRYYRGGGGYMQQQYCSPPAAGYNSAASASQHYQYPAQTNGGSQYRTPTSVQVRIVDGRSTFVNCSSRTIFLLFFSSKYI